MEVGIRDLKNRLSAYMKRVEDGESLVVTDRGRPVARIVPIGMPDHLRALVESGRARPPRGRLRAGGPKIRVTPGPPISDYISEDRG